MSNLSPETHRAPGCLAILDAHVALWFRSWKSIGVHIWTLRVSSLVYLSTLELIHQGLWKGIFLPITSGLLAILFCVWEFFSYQLRYLVTQNMDSIGKVRASFPLPPPHLTEFSEERLGSKGGFRAGFCSLSLLSLRIIMSSWIFYRIRSGQIMVVILSDALLVSLWSGEPCLRCSSILSFRIYTEHWEQISSVYLHPN